MNIVMIASDYIDLSRGGVEMHIYNLSRELEQRGHNVTIIRVRPGPASFESPGPRVIELFPRRSRLVDIGERINMHSRYLRAPLTFIIRALIGVLAARALARRSEIFKDVAIIHHHAFIISAIISRSLRSHGIKQVWTNHLGEYLMVRKVPMFGASITRWMTKAFDAAIGPSKELAEQTGISCEVKYIPNGVDPEIFFDRFASVRTRGTSESVRCIVPRRWAPTKGIEYVAKAMNMRQWPLACKVIFVGTDEGHSPEYAAKVRRILIDARCSYETIGTVSPSRMAELLAGSDLCLIPSVLEATSLSALEAMACGVPVVASDVGGMSEIIRDHENGILIESRSPLAIVNAVGEFMSMTAEERDGIASRARKTVSESYTWRNVASATEKVYVS